MMNNCLLRMEKHTNSGAEVRGVKRKDSDAHRE